MQKKDLKPGYTVQLRNQKYYTVIQEDDKLYISDLGDTKISLDMYDNDLLIDDDPYTYYDYEPCMYDIMKVYQTPDGVYTRPLSFCFHDNLNTYFSWDRENKLVSLNTLKGFAPCFK